MLGFNGGLIGKSRTTNIAAATGVWTYREQAKLRRDDAWPRNVTMLELGATFWYDFSDLATLTINGSNQVTAAVNKGSLGAVRNLTSTATGPINTPAGINGLNTIDWGSSPHSNSLFNTVATATTIAEVFFILDASFGATFPNFNGLFGSTTTPIVLVGGNGGAGMFPASGGTGYDELYINGGAANRYSNVLTTTPTINNPCIVNARHSTTNPSTSDGIRIAMDRNNSGRGWYGLMGEVVLFPSVLSAGDRTTALTILSSKWGITLIP